MPEQIVRLKAQLTALELEEQALQEDIAAGSNRHGDRLGVIEQQRTELEAGRFTPALIMNTPLITSSVCISSATPVT